MRITNINLANFRAFAAPPEGIDIPLPKGENLLVYGENGAGKSSLFLALRNFFEASERQREFSNFQNHFHQNEKGWVRLNFSDCEKDNPQMASWCWGEQSAGFADVGSEPSNAARILREANSCKGFIDYKALLRTYFLPRAGGEINFFPLFIGDPLERSLKESDIDRLDNSRGLLAGIRNGVTQSSFFSEWINLCIFASARNRNLQLKKINEVLPKFNQGLRAELDDLSQLASTYFQFFGYQIEFDFEFGGLVVGEKIGLPRDDTIRLNLSAFGSPIPNHHEFLNEAKLSALALSIFLAAHKRQPTGAIKVLAFDDVLIGLDMSNRLPFLDLLKEHFSDYQIILTTYDRAWFEIVRARTSQNGWPTPWKTVEMFVGKTEDFESPVVKTDEKSLLELAREFFDAHFYKAAAVYARTHFEHLLKDYCSKNRLAVAYHENPKKISSNDFWTAIKSRNSEEIRRVEHLNSRHKTIHVAEKTYQVPLISKELAQQVEEARDLFLNPLSHSNIVNPIASEIKKALDAIIALETRLGQA